MVPGTDRVAMMLSADQCCETSVNACERIAAMVAASDAASAPDRHLIMRRADRAALPVAESRPDRADRRAAPGRISLVAKEGQHRSRGDRPARQPHPPMASHR